MQKSFQSCLRGRLGKGGSSYSYALVTRFPKAIKNPRHTVREHGLFVIEQSSRPSKHQNGSRHIAVMATASGGVLNLGGELRLVLLVALASRHLRGENAGSDCVDADFAVLESGGEHAGDVGAGRLAGCVGELSVAGALHLTTDRGDVDDLGSVAWGNLTALCEERKHGHCHEVLAGHVGFERVRPL
jgi:hypothetical protein